MGSDSYEKILGALLLFLGLSIIAYSLYMGINVFIKAQDPPEIFKPIAANVAPVKNDAKNAENSLPKNLSEINPADLRKVAAGNIFSPDALKAIIPPEIFLYSYRIMNFTVFSMFLWLMIIAGGKVSFLGIALIKTKSDIKA